MLDEGQDQATLAYPATDGGISVYDWLSQVCNLPSMRDEEIVSHLSFAQLLFKEIFDRLVALVGLVLAMPVMLLAALAIRLETPGPVFFKQERGGLNGKSFVIYKFRTMTAEAGMDTKAGHATKHDPRKTRVGTFLRQSSIDELPQLINVLKGDMSIVGPRPHMVYHDAVYRTQVKGYDRRFRAKPGLTGLAQVNGYRGMIREVSDMQNRVDCDNAYIDSWSALLDVKILFKMVWVVLRGINAH